MKYETIRLEGTVQNVVFYNEDNGYIVLEVSSRNDDEHVTVVGMLGNIVEGERLMLEGSYSTHSRFGIQFRAVYCERKLPTELADIEAYLASGMFAGIGKKMAKRIVDKFGNSTFDIIANQPQLIATIKGIPQYRAMEISKQFKQNFVMQEVSSYLFRFGIQSSVAMQACQKWDVNTLAMVKENPYILCCEEISVPFETAESIAQYCGLDRNSYDRAVAGFVDTLNTAATDGHTCLPRDMFVFRAKYKLSIPEEVFNAHLNRAYDTEILDLYTDTNGAQYVYLHQYMVAEMYIAKKVCYMTQTQHHKYSSFSKNMLALEKSLGIEYGEFQRKAINEALSGNFTVLTGNPGTGKTTTLNAIITMFKNRGLKVAIAAPTGRAANRISEITGYEAMTIHRLLEVSFLKNGTSVFNRNEKNPLKCNVLIVDEMSMVDTLLFESLLRAISVTCQVVVVGDSNQLPSVGAGNVLKDLIESQKVNVVTLTEVFRQAQESAIIMNAHRILRGEYPDILTKDKDFFFLQRLNTPQVIDTILEVWQTRLPKAFGYDPIDDIQVLTPSKKGELGTVSLNNLMQSAINPKTSGSIELKNGTYTFRRGDKVMQTKNNYDVEWEREDGTSGKGIYNGDIGTIVKMAQGELDVDFDGRIVTYASQELDQLELAYAVTIHKSQGSEFDVVVMPMLKNFKLLSYRNLLYTGITRAKKLLVMVGSVNELHGMVDNDQKILRYTCLKDIINHEFKHFE